MTTSATKTVLAATGGIAAAVASTLCCAGPLVAVALGLSGAGLAATFEPLRPYVVAGTVLALGFGFVELRREEKRACEPGTLCASPIARRRMKRALWIATIVAIPLLTFPWWSKLILGFAGSRRHARCSR
jgi:mercuric ion transport protein